MEKKNLSDVLNVKEILDSPNNRICILAGVGAGKNYFITHKLKGHGNIFFISSRRATINEMLINELCKEKVDWNKFDDEIFSTTNYGVELLVKNKRFSTTGIKNILEHYNIIVVDEFHSLKSDATFASSTFHVYKFIDFISKKYPNVKIIVMTGTKEPIIDILNRDNYQIIDKREECVNVIPQRIEVITKKESIEIIQHLPKDTKTVYYTNSAHGALLKEKRAKPLIDKICNKDLINKNEVCFAMADNTAIDIMKKANIQIKKEKKTDTIINFIENNVINESNPIEDLNVKVKHIKNYIANHNKLPENKKILITTSTLKEGINIIDENIKFAFCESHLLSDLQQFAGRFRMGLDTLYIINDASQFDIDDEKQKKLFLEMYFNLKILEYINDFFNSIIKDETSVIYMKNFGNFKSNELEYFKYWLEDDWSIYSIIKAAQMFIDSIENKFEYIRFNHLEGKFELFISAFREQMRIHEYYKSDWEKQVSEFCNLNNIRYINNTESKKIDIERIKNLLNSYLNRKLLEKNEKNALLLLFSNEFGLKSKKPKITTCNNLLIEYNLPYHIKDGNTKKVRYYEVIYLNHR